MSRLEELIKQLPPELEREVEQYVAALLSSHAEPRPRPLRLDWRGALEDLKDRYTSVELQHEILRWRELSALTGLERPARNPAEPGESERER